MNTANTDTEILDLLDRVGIELADRDTRLGDDVTGHRDLHGAPDPDGLTLRFATAEDRDALDELTARSSVEEYGCDWAYVYPTGLLAMFTRGDHVAVVPRHDIPELAGLLRLELAGEFALTPRQARRRTRDTWLIRINLALLAALMLQRLLAPERAGGLWWAAVITLLVSAFIADVRLSGPGDRRALDVARARATT